ncbi:hypothetical protein CB1_000465011 [Camelus ferus]|nr:hypothetical protein CB1_000465011 [Camelus ferus]
MQRTEAGQPIIKFNHCQKPIYSFSVPRCCPLCQRDMGARKLGEAPRAGGSSPLVEGGPRASPGAVYNYTVRGVQRDEAGWEQSVSIPLLQPGMFGLMDQWDKYLEDFSCAGAWLPHRYEEDQHNCYSYALTFINYVLAVEGQEPLDKDQFTEMFVVPRTRKASKYITLHRAIEERGFYVPDRPDPETSLPPGSGSAEHRAPQQTGQDVRGDPL